MADQTRRVQVERTIGASPEELFDLVSAVTRMGEWSPETTGCAWVGGATGPAVGARFKGENAKGSKSWSTDCTVTELDRPRRFAFEVRAVGLKVARWSYDFEPAEGGCRVVETWDDQRGFLATKAGGLVSGTTDRAEHNRSTMETTLERLAAAVERR